MQALRIVFFTRKGEILYMPMTQKTSEITAKMQGILFFRDKCERYKKGKERRLPAVCSVYALYLSKRPYNG